MIKIFDDWPSILQYFIYCTSNLSHTVVVSKVSKNQDQALVHGRLN